METFKLFAVVVAGTLWSAWLALYLRENDVNPIREILDRFGRLGWACKVGVLFLVVQMTMFGGAKHGGTNDVDDVTETNQVEIVGGGGQSNLTSCAFGTEEGRAFHCPPPPLLSTSGIPLADITRGYRLESVVTNDDISYAMPSNGTIRGTWHLTGAYEDVQKVGLGGLGGLGDLEGAAFKFPLGTNICSSLWAYTWGKVRLQLKNATNEIVAVGASMSAIPEVSRYWTMVTTNDTYLLTWENFALGRIPASTNASSLIPHPSSLVSAQLELSRNGDFITRSNNVETVYRRVIELNPITPSNPKDPDSPGMPLHPYGPVQDLSVIEETNAYCWVDIVVNNADAWVRFEGDGPSNLADPSFAAKAGETNRVVILIGKTYRVTCDMQFSIVAKSDPAIDEWWEDDRTLWLNWPVSIEAWEGNGNSFRMHVDPGGLGGTFVWTESDCPLSGSGSFFSYSCDTNSLCPGCAAKGHYDYEGYEKDCTGGWCGCSYVPMEPDVLESEPDDGPYAGGASVSFSGAAVIFEDGYVNMPGEFVPRQSTRTTLSCVAHGGPNGGTATFSISGDDKLVRVSGRSLPVTVSVPPEQKVAFEVVYEGQEPSERERDIVATATFTEEDNPPSSSDAKLTSVKVELTPEDLPPMNPSPHRHILGLREKVNYEILPAGVDVELDDGRNGLLLEIDSTAHSLFCPWTSGVYRVVACLGTQGLSIPLRVEEPHVVCRGCRWLEELDSSAVVGEAGWVGMVLLLYLEPSTVSFEWIMMEEIPVPSSEAIALSNGDYFAVKANVLPCTHDSDAGAGKWVIPRLFSDGSYWMGDRARIPYSCPPISNNPTNVWIRGEMRWKIPVGWGNGLQVLGQEVPDPTEQVYQLESNGDMTIHKYKHSIKRDIRGRVWCDGVQVNYE